MGQIELQAADRCPVANARAHTGGQLGARVSARAAGIGKDGQCPLVVELVFAFDTEHVQVLPADDIALRVFPISPRPIILILLPSG